MSFGTCSSCGENLKPVWFVEEETIVDPIFHTLIHTGRTRRAVDYLECPYCGCKECVDDSFDGPWEGEESAYAQMNYL